MAFTYDTTTDLGKVRLLIRDTDATKAKFNDAEIATFLEINLGELLLAAADACESFAATLRVANETIGDYQTDTSGAAEAWENAAARYRDRCYNTPAFGFIEENYSRFSYLEMMSAEIMRNFGGQ